MTLNKIIVAVACLIITISGCHNNTLFSKFWEMDQPGIWPKNESKNFSVQINQPLTAQAKLFLRYIDGYQFDIIMVELTAQKPSGNVQTDTLFIELKNKDGEYIGQPAFELWDLEYNLSDSLYFHETGTYSFNIKHAMPVEVLPFIAEVGISIIQQN